MKSSFHGQQNPVTDEQDNTEDYADFAPHPFRLSAITMFSM